MDSLFTLQIDINFLFIHLPHLFYQLSVNLPIIFSYKLFIHTNLNIFCQVLKLNFLFSVKNSQAPKMWKTVNSVYKSANKNIKKLGKNIPSISTVSSSIQNIQINTLIPTMTTKPQSQVSKTMNSIFNNKKPVMPVNKMSLVAEMSYDSQNFDQICDMILEKIKVFKYQAKYAKKTLNAMVLLSYLIKNAPSGFVDEFRQQMNVFEQHSQLSLQNAYISDDKEIQKLKPLLVEIKQRAKYIMALLTDKKKLLKEKQIAMQVRRKIIEGTNKENQKLGNDRQKNSMLFEGNLTNESGDKSSMGDKMDSFLQHYVWKYWNRFDQKMQNITQKIIQKIDQYLDLQQPQSFQIEQIQADNSQTLKTQTNLEEKVKIQEHKFLKQRNDLEVQIKEQSGPVLNTQLV